MKTSRGGQVGLAVVVGFLIAGGAARGATFTWNAAGDGDWSNTANWTITGSDADGVPDQDDDIVINDVASGMRTITLDATPGGYGATYWRYKSLVVNQSTGGATNRLLFSNSLRMDSSEYQTGTSFNVTDGNVIMDTAGYDWEWNSLATGGSRTFPAGVAINATGGSKMNMRSWHASPSALIQGPVTVSSGTVTAFEGSGTPSVKTTFDTASTVAITANGVLSSINTIEIKGTLTGDGTGGLRPRGTDGATHFYSGTSLGSQLKLMSGSSIQVDDGAYFDGKVYLNTDDFDYRSKSVSTVLTNVTIAPRGSGGNGAAGTIGSTAPYSHGNGYGAPGKVEVTANSDTSINWGIDKLTFKRLNMDGSTFSDRGALMLTDRYDNDPASADKEYLLVNSVGVGSWENLYLSDATQGYDVHVNGGVGNWTSLPGLHLGDLCDGAESTIRFLVPGGAFTLAQTLYLSRGAHLGIVGPATVQSDHWSGISVYFTAGGTLAFDGNLIDLYAYNNTPGTATIDAYGTHTVYGHAEAVSTNGAASGATLVIKGHLQTGFGSLLAGGEEKLWVSGAPKITPPSRIDIQGNYLTWVWNDEGEHIKGQFQLGREATIAVAGNFTQRQFHEGYTGDNLTNNWWVDQSPDCGSLVFNGGGSVVQTWETMSSVATVFTGMNFYAQSATPVAGTTVTGATSNAEATIGKVYNDLLKLTAVSGAFAADEVLNFSDGKTARAYAAQSVRPDLTDNAYPYATVEIGEAGGSNAWVKLVNNEPHRRYEALSLSAVQIERNLIVRNGSTFDLGAQTNILCVGQGTVGGLITNSIAGGTLVLANGAALSFSDGGVIDVDTLTIASGCTVDFNKAQNSYIRVNGDQEAAFEALIAAGRIVNTGGMKPKATYSAGDDHTVVDAPGGFMLLVR